jgi:hypothetical protein
VDDPAFRDPVALEVRVAILNISLTMERKNTKNTDEELANTRYQSEVK